MLLKEETEKEGIEKDRQQLETLRQGFEVSRSKRR